VCLAIFKPAKVILPEESIRNGWISNSDGGGYAFIDKKKVVHRKGIMTLKEFGEAYAADSKQYKKSPFAVHFRIRSMGDKSPSNTHPYPIAKGMLIHNGTIDGTGAVGGVGESDTAKFCKMFGDQLTYEWVKEHKEELETAIGWNKLVMLYDDGKFHIINEKSGLWVGDVWYSNHSFKPRLPHGATCSTGVC
jgi:predicted glutamine amidotransferase